MFPRHTPLPSPNCPPSDSSLLAQCQTIDHLYSPQSRVYWAFICPLLHINDPEFQRTRHELFRIRIFLERVREFTLPPLSKERLQEYQQRIAEDGYFRISAEDLGLDSLFVKYVDFFKFLTCASLDTADLAVSMVQLMQHGWPETFFTVYDEAWAIVHLIRTYMTAVTGNEPNLDILLWYIDPNRGQSGFSPHRDRQPDDVAASFHPNRQPKYSTVWIPFTDACPDNSCLYMLPAPFDPGYFDGDTEQDPLQRALSTKEMYQQIKAIPAEAGSAIMFSHRIIHWGSAGRKGHHTPRIAFSAAFSTPDFEAPYFDLGHLPFPSLPLRIALSAGQMLVYYDRFRLSADEVKHYYEIFKKQSAHFHKDYQTKVVREVVTVLQEESGGSHEDDALQAILDAKLEGIEEFEEDFHPEGDDTTHCADEVDLLVEAQLEALGDDKGIPEHPPTASEINDGEDTKDVDELWNKYAPAFKKRRCEYRK